jgi:hypothetical protein
MTSTEVDENTTAETPETPPEPVLKRCFSGSGKFARRKWAPGGDASYLSRLRKAHLADQTLPDPWYIQEHGGVESENVPEDGWPQMSAIDIARRLDQERGAGVDSHWAHTLETAKDKEDAKAEARATRQKTQAATKEQKAAERAAQSKRPKKGTEVLRKSGDREGQTATVLRHISPTQMLIRFEDGMEELVIDQDNQDVEPVEPSADAEAEASSESTENADEGEFQEQ